MNTIFGVLVIVKGRNGTKVSETLVEREHPPAKVGPTEPFTTSPKAAPPER